MNKPTDQPDPVLYSERITSARTEALFLALMVLCAALFAWRMTTAGPDLLAGIFAGLSGMFLFYMLNFRVLWIQLTATGLKLKFGVFTWSVPAENIQGCDLDTLPALMRFGGAGIHFMTIRKRYRVSFNFLEYPRIVIALKKPQGLVKDISFSTRRPEEVIRLIREAVSLKIYRIQG